MSQHPSPVAEIRPYIDLRDEPRAAAEGWEWVIDPWVFDDPDLGLVREFFALGGDCIVSYAARHLPPSARRGFRLLLSAEPFPDAEFAVLKELTPDFGDGAIYIIDTPDAVKLHDCPFEGWLDPVLLRYLGAFPERLYFKALPLDACR